MVREFAIAHQAAEVIGRVAGLSGSVGQGEQLVGLLLQFRLELVGLELPDLRYGFSAGVARRG